MVDVIQNIMIAYIIFIIYYNILYYNNMPTLGGTINGFSAKPTIIGKKDSEQALSRRVLRDSWNTAYATGTYSGKNRVVTPFRAIMNSGDFLSRSNYVCGGPAPLNKSKPGYRVGSMISKCDTSNVPSSSCNVKFVADSSDYTKFKKQYAMNRNYNDSSNGGDQSNASYVSQMAVRRR